MNQTTSIAKSIQYQSWIEMIRDCQNRPASISIEDWCKSQGISKHAYYWRIKRLRELCLEDVEFPHAPVEKSEFVELKGPQPQTVATSARSSATLRIGNASLELQESISDSFLRRILGAAAHVE